MPAKKKGGRGKTINIVDFNTDYIPEDNFDWAMSAPREKTSEEFVGERPAKRDYSRTANNTLMTQGGFRDAPSEQISRAKDVDKFQPPFVAHFGNLRNGTTEQEFLRNFHEDCVATLRLISQDGKSFAFVEFKTAQALAIALTMNQSMLKGRKLYVDLATTKQVERLYNSHSGSSRQNAGPSQASNALQNLNLTRDAFGSTQAVDKMDGSCSRSGFGSRNDLHLLAELSRDTLGTATRTTEGPASPVVATELMNWRNEGPVAQPEFNPEMRENRRSETDLERRGGRGRNSKRQSPVSIGGLANWRDEPVTQPPPPPSAAMYGGGNNNNNSSDGGLKSAWSPNRTGHGHQRGAGKTAPAPRDDSKWEALRR